MRLSQTERADILRSAGATGSEVAELLAYGEVVFSRPDQPLEFPLADEPFVADWEVYAREAESDGVVPTLRGRLVQLRFPLVAGISESQAYRAATRTGAEPPPGTVALPLEQPEGIRLLLHPTAAGRIPVMVAATRPDFVALVCALTRRNEPVPLPDSMGACIVGGYNNWDRLGKLRRHWLTEHPNRPSAAWWTEGFPRIKSSRELYQDRFIVLSSGPYSAVSAGELGLSAGEWEQRSLHIRLEHECAHYFTRRVLGSMRNSLQDEIIADYVALVSSEGHYRSDWFLRFMGLEAYPRIRHGGRLENYRGTPPLSAGALRVLATLVERIARNLGALERKAAAGETTLSQRAREILALASYSLEALSLPDITSRILDPLKEPFDDRLILADTV